MVARIGPFSVTISKALNYNEQKVAQNNAELIHSSGFLTETNRLTFHDKLNRFEQLNELFSESKSNTLHVSLNFDPSENLSNSQLSAIADRYMEGLTLENQPYIVYKHTDAGHPHIHIVSTMIRPDGTRVPTHNIAKRLSEPTRKAIEKEFGLVPANAHQKKESYRLQPVDIQKVIYGTQPTKQAMRDVLQYVGHQYKFTSLPEYNAVLRQYNILADQGGKDSRTYRHGGLVYRVLDDQGNKLGVPVKASQYHFKPTLANLEKKYEHNKTAREQDLPKMRQKVDWALQQHPSSLRDFTDGLQKEDIELVIRQNAQGVVYGLTYVDNQLKTVANGSDLGKGYSANAILRQFNAGQQQTERKQKSKQQRPGYQNNPPQNPSSPGSDPSLPMVPGFNANVSQILSTLMKYEEQFGQSPNELREEQSQRRRKKL